MVVVDKERSCKIIDFAVPGDSGIEEKEKDKMENRLFENNQRQLYRELDQEEERCDDDLPVAEVNVKKQHIVFPAFAVCLNTLWVFCNFV